MGSFHKVAITTAILIFAALLAWPLLFQDSEHLEHSAVFLDQEILGDGSAAIIPLPDSLDLDPNRISIGKKLFVDTRLSNNGRACSHCHDLDTAGTSDASLSGEHTGIDLKKNTPTIFNSGFNTLLSWNGQHESLAGQIHAEIHSPDIMASEWNSIVSSLQEDGQYQSLFHKTYPNGINRHSISDSLVTYIRSLTTPDSALDQYLKGDSSALTETQLKGYQLFREYGCISCHQGINIGGNLFAKFGIFKKNIVQKNRLSEFDLGRFSYTRNTEDRFVFRVPSLRNVAATAPYFHDGRATTLHQAVKIMAMTQLDIDISSQHVELIVDFLHSLSGQFEGRRL